MNGKDRSEKTKKEYQAPVITRINLRPEEAVLGHCKNSTSSGPVSPTCNITSCSAIGS
jgi:hypothetical protein